MTPGPEWIRLCRWTVPWLVWGAALAAEGDRERFRGGGALSVDDAALLQAPDSVTAADFGYVPAAKAPLIDAVLYPIPLQEEGVLWSQWGDGLIASDGRFWSAIGDHGGPGGRSYVYAYDPEDRRLELVFDQQLLLGQRQGDWGFGKIHCRLEELEDGRICWGTYWGNAPPEDWEQENEHHGMVVAADPSARRLDILGILKRPYVIPAAMADTRRGLFYALPCDRNWQGQGFAVFDLRQGRTIYYGHVETEASRRFVLVDEAGGGAWFSVRPDTSRQVWLARYDAASNTVEERALPLPEGYGPMRAGTEKRDRRGLFYGVCEGRLVRIDPEGRSSEPLGAVWPAAGGLAGEGPHHGAYTTALEISPGGRYLYAVPWAHGQAWSHGAPVVQFDLKTGARKVLAFLGPLFEGRFGYRVGGSYCLELSADGERLFIGINGQLLEPDVQPPESAFGHPACMVLHIPAQERLNDSP